MAQLDVSLWEEEGRAFNEELSRLAASSGREAFRLRVPMDTLWTLDGENGPLGTAELHIAEGIVFSAKIQLRHYTFTLDGTWEEEAQWQSVLSRDGVVLLREDEWTEGLRVRKWERMDSDGNPYPYTAVDAARVYMRWTMLDEATLRGWWNEQLWNARVNAWMPDTGETQARSWVAEMEAETQVELFYPDFPERAAAQLHPVAFHRLTPEDDLWTWRLHLLFPDGNDMAVRSLLQDFRLLDFSTAVLRFRQQLIAVIPNLFYL